MATGEKYSILERLDYVKSLSSVERCVLDAVLDQKLKATDTEKIAQICRISEVQASIAIQLLTYKNLIPDSHAERSDLV